MFWNEDRIKWYLVASEYTKYHDNMKLEIKKIIPEGESLVDFGCGLGILPMKLSDYLSDIIGVDYDEHVLGILEDSISKKNIKNFKTICSNCYNGELVENIVKPDNILFSHFGNIQDYFYNFYNLFNKRMIIIRNDVEKNIVHNHNKNTIQDICNFLEERKISYNIYRQTYEFGQPLKDEEEVLKYLDDISEDAKIIGSVNTIKIDPETKKITGYNTDGRGFIASLDELKIPFRKQKVVLVGVGGAGRAIAIQLAYEGVGELCIKELNKDLANEIKETINKHSPNVNVKILADNEETLKEELKNACLLINATPLGMKGRESLCVISGPEVLHKDLFVYDIVYDPRETLLMKYAKQAGCKTTNGINMMIWQGAIAFKIWFDIDMPQDYVRQELFEK